MKRLLITTVVLGSLLACSREAPAPASPSSASPADTPVAPSAGEAATPGPGYRVQVRLSDAAQARLAPAETVIVSATYFADAAPEAIAQADEAGRIGLGSAQVELPGAGEAAFDAAVIQRERLPLTRGEVQVNVNVFSGRKTSGDNLLDCGMLEGPLAQAERAPPVLDCRLIEGEPGS